MTDASGTVARSRVACIDLSTALCTSWDPGSASRIHALFSDDPVSPTSIYLCAQAVSPFAIGGVTTKVAKTHPITGVVDAGWILSLSASADVNCGVVVGSTVYLGGTFTSVQGATRYYAAAVSVADATVQSWHPGNGDNVDTGDWINSYGEGVRFMQAVGGSILLGGAFYVRTSAVVADYLAVGWGYADPISGVFSQAGSGTASGGAVCVLAGENNFYLTFNRDGIAPNTMRALPEWDSPPATAYPADKWAILSGGSPSVYPTSPNGGINGYPQYVVEDLTTTDFFLLGNFDDAFGVSGADSAVRVTAGGARVAGFAPVFGAGTNVILCGVRVGDALIYGGTCDVTVNGVSKSMFTAVHATTGANY